MCLLHLVQWWLQGLKDPFERPIKRGETGRSQQIRVDVVQEREQRSRSRRRYVPILAQIGSSTTASAKSGSSTQRQAHNRGTIRRFNHAIYHTRQCCVVEPYLRRTRGRRPKLDIIYSQMLPEPEAHPVDLSPGLRTRRQASLLCLPPLSSHPPRPRLPRRWSPSDSRASPAASAARRR